MGARKGIKLGGKRGGRGETDSDREKKENERKEPVGGEKVSPWGRF